MDKRHLHISYPQTERLRWKMPMTGYLLLLAIGVWLLLFFFKANLDKENETATYVLHFIQLFLGVTISLIALFSFLSVFIPWLIFRNRKNNASFLLKLSNDEKNKIIFQTKPILKPFGGLLKVGFIWQNDQMSIPVLLQNQKIENQHTTAGLTKYIAQPTFPNITDYNIENVVFYFIDFLHFFQFYVKVPKQILVVNRPESTEAKTISIQPLKTQSEAEKVFSNRKTSGDLYNFKHYESNDDFRRIVWPLYAKTGEMMVRNPEIQHQYASDALIYASFNSHLTITNEMLSNHLLDFYKNVVFTAYKRLKEKEDIALYFTTSQNTQTAFTKEKDVVNHIASCQWETNKNIDQMPRPDQTSLVIVSSLDDVNAIENLVGKNIYGMEFLLVPLSETFKNPRKRDWLQWIFFHPKKNGLLGMQLRWKFSSTRKKVIEQEQRIAQILSQKPVTTSLR